MAAKKAQPKSAPRKVKSSNRPTVAGMHVLMTQLDDAKSHIRRLEYALNQVPQPAPAQEPMAMGYVEKYSDVVNAEVPRKVSALTAAISALDRGVNDIACALHRLEDQATAILLPESRGNAVAADGEQTAPAPMEAPAVLQLHYLIGSLERLAIRINNITARVQA